MYKLNRAFIYHGRGLVTTRYVCGRREWDVGLLCRRGYHSHQHRFTPHLVTSQTQELSDVPAVAPNLTRPPPVPSFTFAGDKATFADFGFQVQDFFSMHASCFDSMPKMLTFLSNLLRESALSWYRAQRLALAFDACQSAADVFAVLEEVYGDKLEKRTAQRLLTMLHHAARATITSILTQPSP